MINLTKLENEWFDYIPEFNDNRKCKNGDQITCQIKYISQEDQDELTDAIIGQQRDGFKNKAPIKWSKAHHKLINDHVKDIKNVKIDNQNLTSMKDLYKDPRLTGLYKEIAEALDISNNLEDFEIKN